MESPQKGSHFRESPPSPRDRLRSDYVVGMAITNRMSGAITKEFRWANGLVPPASDARKSVSPVISSAWWRPQCPWAETASGEKAPDAATLPCLLYLG